MILFDASDDPKCLTLSSKWKEGLCRPLSVWVDVGKELLSKPLVTHEAVPPGWELLDLPAGGSGAPMAGGACHCSRGSSLRDLLAHLSRRMVAERLRICMTIPNGHNR